jgi:hypothetical protein
MSMKQKNAVFWDVVPCGSCKNQHFGGKYCLNQRVTGIGELGMLAVTSNKSKLQRNNVLLCILCVCVCVCVYIVFLCSVLRLVVTANVAPSSSILVTLIMEVIRSSKTLVLTRATQCNIPEEGILHVKIYFNSLKYIKIFMSLMYLSFDVPLLMINFYCHILLVNTK